MQLQATPYPHVASLTIQQILARGQNVPDQIHYMLDDGVKASRLLKLLSALEKIYVKDCKWTHENPESSVKVENCAIRHGENGFAIGCGHGGDPRIVEAYKPPKKPYILPPSPRDPNNAIAVLQNAITLIAAMGVDNDKARELMITLRDQNFELADIDSGAYAIYNHDAIHRPDARNEELTLLNEDNKNAVDILLKVRDEARVLLEKGMRRLATLKTHERLPPSGNFKGIIGPIHPHHAEPAPAWAL